MADTTRTALDVAVNALKDTPVWCRDCRQWTVPIDSDDRVEIAETILTALGIDLHCPEDWLAMAVDGGGYVWLDGRWWRVTSYQGPDHAATADLSPVGEDV